MIPRHLREYLSGFFLSVPRKSPGLRDEDRGMETVKKPRRVRARRRETGQNHVCREPLFSANILFALQVWNLCALSAQIMRVAGRSLLKREPAYQEFIPDPAQAVWDERGETA